LFLYKVIFLFYIANLINKSNLHSIVHIYQSTNKIDTSKHDFIDTYIETNYSS